MSTEARYAKSCRNEFWQKVFRYELEYLLVRLQGCRDVVSIGCGPAVIERALSKRGFNVTGLDVSQQALSEAPKSIRTVATPAEKMPFPDNSFDAAIYVASLQFIEDYVLALDKTIRVLRENGRIVVMLLNPKAEYFKDRLHNPDSYISRIRHADLQEMEAALAKRFAVRSEYFLQLKGGEVLASFEEQDAALYIIWGAKRSTK